MLRIRLPFPARSLSPNSRRVWQASLKPKAEAREVGYWAARKANKETWIPNRYRDLPAAYPPTYYLSESFDSDKPLRLRIAIRPPDNRRRDYINVLAALKNYEDGIFDYIGWDDRHIKHVDIRWRRSCPDGKIVYILYQK